MKYDFSVWNEVKTNEKTPQINGKVRLLASCPCALYAQSGSHSKLVGYGSAWDLEITQALSFFVDQPKARLFYTAPVSSVTQTEGEVFTNIDRLSDESDSLREIRRAMRDLQISKRQALQEIRAFSRSDVDVRGVSRPDPDPVLEPVSDDT